MPPPDKSLASDVTKNANSPAQATVPFALLLLALTACFGLPLFHLLVFSFKNDLYSHIILIPCVSAYLIWIKRPELKANSAPNRKIAGCLLGLGALVLASYLVATSSGATLPLEDSLSLQTLSFLLLFVGLCSWFLGQTTLRALAFPFGFLVFMVPFPSAVTNGIESFLQHTSATAAGGFFALTGTTFFQEDLVFHLPGISLQVAPECSGIRSSLALFITSVLAGHFFLRSPWKCALLTLAVVPLAILRNGFRIFTLGQLCIHINPDIINSAIHHRGGPIFFALSLIPFFLLLRYLYRSEQRSKSATPPAA